MKRRNFLKNISKASMAPFILNGLPFREMANSEYLQQMAAMSSNDRVLVLIQLHGGNDGLNTLVPLNQYSQYQSLRSNIALTANGARRYQKLDSSLADEAQIGLHPDMASFKRMYDNGQAAIVQAVAYENMNGSHFRSRDIWLMGGDYDDHLSSGWAGRYLDAVFPAYPDEYPSREMPDPLALEIGYQPSLAFHREDGIPASLAIDDPEGFYDLVNSVGSSPTTASQNSYYGQELAYIMGTEQKSNQYAERLQKVFRLGRNSAEYPDKYILRAPASHAANKLSVQLKTIARLLSGGCRTRIFLARINGFDTHAHQVEMTDPSMGSHAALLYNLFSAVEAFQKDLKALGLEDKVITTTFSEFGRRPASNGSYGTDHGTAAPLFVFGKHVNAGVIGKNPDLSDLTAGQNLRHQHDYRQVFATLLADWLEAPGTAISAAKFDAFSTAGKKLPLIANIASGAPAAPAPEDHGEVSDAGHQFYDCYPNPATDHIMARYKMNGKVPHRIYISDRMGNELKVYARKGWVAGEKDATFELSHLKAGIYFCTLEVGSWKVTKQFIKK